MKKLLELAGKIKEKRLRVLVIKTLKNPGKLSNSDFSYKTEDFRITPASLTFHHTYEGGLVEHTYAVTSVCIGVAEALQKVYKVEIDMDTLIAAALLHDIGKLWNWKKNRKEWQQTSLTLDHSFMGVAELYARGFPEKVLHPIASHFGQEGPTPPMTMEALILHLADNFDAKLGQVNQEDVLRMLLGGKG